MWIAGKRMIDQLVPKPYSLINIFNITPEEEKRSFTALRLDVNV